MPTADLGPGAPSSQLVWQLVKQNNCFLVKGLHGVQLSAEPHNLANVNSYKYSGKPPGRLASPLHPCLPSRFPESHCTGEESAIAASCVAAGNC